MEQDCNLELLFSLENAELYEIKEGQKIQIDKGTLGIYRFEGQEYSNLFLILNSFKYCILEEFPILSSKDGRSYILPNLQSYIGICLPAETSQTDIELFEIFISKKAELLGYVTPDELEPEKTEKKDKENSNGKSRSSSNIGGVFLKILDKGGDLLLTGVNKTASTISKGIAMGGGYIKGKISKNDKEVEISEETQKRVKLLNEATKAILVFKNHQKRLVVNLAKEIASEIKKAKAKPEDNKEGKDEEEQKNDENKNPDAVDVCLKAADKVVDIYEGMMEAMATLTKGVADAAGGIIEKKYGKDAADVSKDTFELANNVISLKKGSGKKK